MSAEAVHLWANPCQHQLPIMSDDWLVTQTPCSFVYLLLYFFYNFQFQPELKLGVAFREEIHFPYALCIVSYPSLGTASDNLSCLFTACIEEAPCFHFQNTKLNS